MYVTVMGSSGSKEKSDGAVKGGREDRERDGMEETRIQGKDLGTTQSTSTFGPARRKKAALESCAEHQLRLMRCYHDQNLPARLSRIARSMTSETSDEIGDDEHVFSAGCEEERKRF